MDQLAWQNRHVAPVRRYSAVPLWVRIDKLKTAVASGAGPTAVLTRPSRRLRVPGLHDRSLSRLTGSDKIKIELRVLSARVDFADLFVADWPDLAAFQGALDQRSEECHQTRQCPTTGSSIADGHMAERRLLQALPTLDELFDGFVARRASRDWLVSFEGRRYSVPFAWIRCTVEKRGTTQLVVVWGDGRKLARHPRGEYSLRPHTFC